MKIRSSLLAAIVLFLSLGSDNSHAQGHSRLANISTRMQVSTGEDVLIGGFVIGGSSNKTVAVVATGPSLVAYGIPNPLGNPTLTLVRSSDQAVIGANDDWEAAGNAAQLSAAGFAPSNPLEAAILINLPPGAYTAIVRGVGNGTGVSVLGVYEVDSPSIPLINISARGKVLTGSDVMIGGFVIQGPVPQTVAVVATGPSLSSHGIANPLANPTVTLVRSSDQAVIASNDNWTSHANAGQLQAAGLSPPSLYESGLFLTLPPGAYTAVVSGVGDTTGVAVLGIYVAPLVAQSSAPAHTAQFMPVHTSVSVTFSRSIDPSTISPGTFSLTGPFGPVAATLSVDGNTATLTPSAPLLTAASYTGTVTTGVRDLAGISLASTYSFTFTTAVGEPPPIVAGCPAPEAGAEIRRFEWGETPILLRASGAITTYRLKQSQIGWASVTFVQGQTAFTPGSTHTEITISRCPGVIEPGLHPSCRLETSPTPSTSITGFNRLPSGYNNQQELASLGCLAPEAEQHYVNVRWTYPACNNSQGCGFSLQWVEGGQ